VTAEGAFDGVRGRACARILEKIYALTEMRASRRVLVGREMVASSRGQDLVRGGLHFLSGEEARWRNLGSGRPGRQI